MNEITNVTRSQVDGEVSLGLPNSIEAEQQLLGAILTNNDLFDRVSSIVRSEHFFEAKVSAIKTRINSPPPLRYRMEFSKSP